MKKLLSSLSLLSMLSILSSLEASVLSSKSPWGCNPVWPHWITDTLKRIADYDSVLDFTVSCGMSWVRPPLAPSGTFDTSVMDPFVRTINRHSVNLVWVTDPDNTSDTSVWMQFWDSVVTRYGTGGNMSNLTKPVKYWEICNEPDGSYFKFWINNCRSVHSIVSGPIPDSINILYCTPFVKSNIDSVVTISKC